jgi:hypothetical protein
MYSSRVHDKVSTYSYSSLVVSSPSSSSGRTSGKELEEMSTTVRNPGLSSAQSRTAAVSVFVNSTSDRLDTCLSPCSTHNCVFIPAFAVIETDSRLCAFLGLFDGGWNKPAFRFLGVSFSLEILRGSFYVAVEGTLLAASSKNLCCSTI